MSSYLEIFKRLRIEMNGAVSQSMREGGIVGLMNYGVSLPTIKAVAAEYYPNHAMAAELWRQEIREMRLAAVFVENPQEVTLEQVRSWGEGFATVEIAQIAAMQLLWKVENIEIVASEWFASDNQPKHLAACHIIGKLASKLQAETLKPFVTPQGNAFMLREIYHAHGSLRAEIAEIKDQVFDLAWQIED